jgi:hypothetical protein
MYNETVAAGLWCVIIAFIILFLYSWIPVYAFFTARNSNWLTREIKAPARDERKRTSFCNGDTGNLKR